MLNEKNLMKNAMDEMISSFGRKYLQDNFEDIWKSDGYVNGNKEFQLFLGIKSKDDLPDRKANGKGWVVYGLVRIDAETGKITKKEIVTE